MRFRNTASVVVAVLGTATFAMQASAHEASGLSFGQRLIHSTDHAARVTQRCQRANRLAVTRNPRNYALPHSRGYRRDAHRRWHQRRRECQTYARWLGVPQWFVEIAMCIHRGESGDWYERYDEGTIYGGGMQYHPSTWIQAGGRRFAPTAYQASPAQQIRAAWDLTYGGQDYHLHVHWEAQDHCF